MVEILPIKLLTDEDGQIFGSLAVSLGKLNRAGLPVAAGIVVSPPHLKFKTVLEHFEFKTKEVFEQSLTLVKKEIKAIEIPSIMLKEVGKHNRFLVSRKLLKSLKELWFTLLDEWIEEVRVRLWKDGFYQGISENLEPKIVIFVKKMESNGGAYFDNFGDDTVINIKMGRVHPSDLKRLDELVREANKKLFIPHQYEWILDGGIKLTKVLLYTPQAVIPQSALLRLDLEYSRSNLVKTRSAVKVFLDLSTGLVVEEDIDGVFIASEKIFDLNKPNESFENLIFKLVETSSTFPSHPVFLKLADKSEGMGKVRGALRLLHQKSLFDPMVDALDFVRHKRGLTNVHMVIPFVRGVGELMKIKRELAVKKLARKNSLQLWLEIAVPENIINLENYLICGLDGVVINLDELISFLNGFDSTQDEVAFYKNEVSGLLKFLEDGIKLLHKAKIPFIAYGSLSMYPEVLEFLVEKGVYGIVVERYEVTGAHDLLHQAERKLILRRST